jgi:heme A synthase
MDWLALVKTVAPWIGTAIAGPAGPLVGMAVSAAADALGLSEKTVEAVKAAVSGATPEMLQAMKRADQDFALRMQEIGFKNIADLEAIAAADRDSARKMQISAPSWVPAALSVTVTIGYFVVLIGMMTRTLQLNDSQVMLMMLGSLTTAWGVVLAYWFGTTRESNRKSDMLAQATPVK